MKKQTKNKRKPSKDKSMLARPFMSDFDRKASGHRPEQTKRMICTIFNGTVAATGVNAFGQVNSAGVVNSSDFAAMQNAAVYREFRVVAIRMRICGLFQLPVTPGTVPFGVLIGCIGGGDNAPPNSNVLMLNSQGFKIARGVEQHLELYVDCGINPNARLWTSIKAVTTFPAENQLWAGWRFTEPFDATYNGKRVTSEFYEYDVEFRTA
jgi:hypothetical protein